MLNSLKRKLKGNPPGTGTPLGTLASSPGAGPGGHLVGSVSPTVPRSPPASMQSAIDIDQAPRADVSLPHAQHPTRRERRRSSIVREERASVLKELPLLKDVPLAKREALFKQKLSLCCIEFNWDDPESDKKNKEMKRLNLVELVDHVNTANGQKIFTETAMPDIVNMVATNIFRSLPPPTASTGPGGEEVTGAAGGEDGEEEPYLDPAWPHLQLVYEFFLRYIVSTEVKAKAAKKYIDATFCAKLIEMFDSEDPRERDYLKTILHRIYGKFMGHRSHIRKAIANVFYRFVYETERHNGVAELLEILGSIINGFALPLKPEHVQFLERALIPLHRPRSINHYFQQLCYCITQYIDKDANTAAQILSGLIRAWPWSSSSKQIVLLNEIEEILEMAGPAAVQPIIRPLFKTIGKCVGSSHFQVAERALFLWNNDHLLSDGILSKAYTSAVLPLIFSALQTNSQGHWNATVEALAQNVMKHYMEADPMLYERCAAMAASADSENAAQESVRRSRWATVEGMALQAAHSAATGTGAGATATKYNKSVLLPPVGGSKYNGAVQPNGYPSSTG